MAVRPEYARRVHEFKDRAWGTQEPLDPHEVALAVKALLGDAQSADERDLLWGYVESVSMVEGATP